MVIDNLKMYVGYFFLILGALLILGGILNQDERIGKITNGRAIIYGFVFFMLGLALS